MLGALQCAGGLTKVGPGAAQLTSHRNHPRLHVITRRRCTDYRAVDGFPYRGSWCGDQEWLLAEQLCEIEPWVGDEVRWFADRVVAEEQLPAVAAGEASILGDIVADPAYTTREFLANVKAMNAAPFGRLHRTNQEGLRYDHVGVGKRAGEIVTFNGHPVCECMAHTPLPDIRYPKFPFTTRQLLDYQRELAKTAPFEWTANGPAGPDGSRQFIAPHKGVPTDKLNGGCEHCIDETGGARLGPDGRPRRRCCSVRSRRVSAEALVLHQGPRIGSPEWHAKWNPRNRVEGSYGILKNLAVIGYCRSYHQYVGIARETLISAFALVAYNFHMLNQWKAREALAPADLDDDFDPFGNLPSDQPTAIAPPVASPAPVKRGPKGLPIFAMANAGDDDPAST
jgi:hypothetical protein